MKWTDAQCDLWRRIAAHPFEIADHALDFLHRLARETGWTVAFARGAVEEYRRFCFLVAGSTQQITPSEEVDAVWHLHLVYTRDYWDVWCAEAIRARLHHDPTQGGPSEQRRFRAQYATTLAFYEEFFGPPPAPYWPATRHRFRTVLRFRNVDTDCVFILPRPRRRRT